MVDADKSTERRLARKVIRIAIRDLKKGRMLQVKGYFKSPNYVVHRHQAAYPAELDDIVADALVCSEVHRKKLCEEIDALLGELDKLDAKK